MTNEGGPNANPFDIRHSSFVIAHALAHESLTDYLRTALDLPLHTFGEYLDFHPSSTPLSPALPPTRRWGLPRSSHRWATFPTASMRRAGPAPAQRACPCRTQRKPPNKVLDARSNTQKLAENEPDAKAQKQFSLNRAASNKQIPINSNTPFIPGSEEPPGKARAAIALLLLLPFPTVGTAASMFWWPGKALGQAVFVFSKVWIVVLPLFWLLWIERGRVSWSPPRRGGFGLAALLGLLIAAAIFLAYAVTQNLGWIDPVQVAERARQTGLSHIGVYLGGALYWVTLNSLMEEYVWRWFCFRQCEALLGGVGAVVASAIGFTLHHVIALAGQFSWPMTLLGSFGIFCAGAIWSWLYLRYRSVWPCYVSHAIVDMPIFILGYRMIFGAS